MGLGFGKMFRFASSLPGIGDDDLMSAADGQTVLCSGKGSEQTWPENDVREVGEQSLVAVP